MSLFDLKVINSVLRELEEDRGIPHQKILNAIEMSLAAAYKKEYGKRGQIIRAHFNMDVGSVEFKQIKIVVDDTLVRPEVAEGEEAPEVAEDDDRTRFNPEHHMMIEDARRIKKDVELDEEIEFPLEEKEDFGRIASQTAKQVIMQKIREAEKISIMEEFGEREGQIVSGHVQRFERGSLYIDLGRATGILQYEDQIPGERYRQGERVRALLYKVDEGPRGTFLKLSRAHSQFLVKLFEMESPELAAGTIEIKAVAREAGSRSKLAVITNDDHIDPVGSLVGQRGVRVTTVTSELGGEKIDIIEWAEDTNEFIERALSPAEVLGVEIVENDDGEKRASVEVAADQQSLAIGRGGQNVRLAAKLTGWGIDITSAESDAIAGKKAQEESKTAKVEESTDEEKGTDVTEENTKTSDEEATKIDTEKTEDTEVASTSDDTTQVATEDGVEESEAPLETETEGSNGEEKEEETKTPEEEK